MQGIIDIMQRSVDIREVTFAIGENGSQGFLHVMKALLGKLIVRILA